MSEMIKKGANGLAPGFETNPYEKLDDLLFDSELEFIVFLEDDYLKQAMAQFLNDNNLQQKNKNYQDFEYMFISLDLGTFNFIEEPNLKDKRLYELPLDWDELMIELRSYIAENPFEKKEIDDKNPESWSQPIDNGGGGGKEHQTQNDGKSFMERAKEKVLGAKEEDTRTLYEMLAPFNGSMCEIEIDSPGKSETLTKRVTIHDVSPGEVVIEFDGVKIEADKILAKLEGEESLTLTLGAIVTDVFINVVTATKENGKLSQVAIDLFTGTDKSEKLDNLLSESTSIDDEEYIFAICEDLNASNQLLDPQAMIQITPKSYWLSDGCAYDQHIEQDLRSKYPHLKNLGRQLEELAEGSFTINDGSANINTMMHLNTQDTINELCKAGIKMNKDFQNFMSSKDTQMVEVTMNSLGFGNLIE